MGLSQIELLEDIIASILRQGISEVNNRQMNKMIQAASAIVDEFDKPDIKAFPNMGLDAWLKSDDTGLSSKYMVRVLKHKDKSGQIHWPHDPSDFGRCFMLLEAVPELRENLGDMSQTCKEWKALVENWQELCDLYNEELPQDNAPKLALRMKELLGE